MHKIALIVGHELKGRKKGAKNYLGEYESEYNNRVALKVQESFEECRLFYRDGKTRKQTGKEVQDYNPDLSIELHFNAFHKPAFGCEVLALEDDLISQTFAKKLATVISDNMDIRLRHGSGLLKIGRLGRGYSNLKHAKSDHKPYPVVLVEPCFANIRTKESEKFFEDPSDYIRCLVIAIKGHFNHYEKKVRFNDDNVEKSPKHILDAVAIQTRKLLKIKGSYE